MLKGGAAQQKTVKALLKSNERVRRLALLDSCLKQQAVKNIFTAEKRSGPAWANVTQITCCILDVPGKLKTTHITMVLNNCSSLKCFAFSADQLDDQSLRGCMLRIGNLSKLGLIRPSLAITGEQSLDLLYKQFSIGPGLWLLQMEDSSSVRKSIIKTMISCQIRVEILKVLDCTLFFNCAHFE